MRKTIRLKALIPTFIIMIGGMIIIEPSSISHRSDNAESSVMCDNTKNQNRGFQLNKRDIQRFEYKLNNPKEEINGEVLSCFSINTRYIESGSEPIAGMSHFISLASENEAVKEVKVEKQEVLKEDNQEESKQKFSQDEIQVLCGSSNRWNITLTEDEIDLLAKIVWVESRGESDLGQQAVVEVVFNRMIFKYEFSGSVYDVLSQDGQFCSWRLRNTATPTEKEYNNIYKVLNGETDILKFNTVYFSTSPRNENLDKPIGNHYFCGYEIND